MTWVFLIVAAAIALAALAYVGMMIYVVVRLVQDRRRRRGNT